MSEDSVWSHGAGPEMMCYCPEEDAYSLDGEMLLSYNQYFLSTSPGLGSAGYRGTR